MYEIISEWLNEDLTALLGSYTQPVVAALVVGLGLCACLFFSPKPSKHYLTITYKPRLIFCGLF